MSLLLLLYPSFYWYNTIYFVFWVCRILKCLTSTKSVKAPRDRSSLIVDSTEIVQYGQGHLRRIRLRNIKMMQNHRLSFLSSDKASPSVVIFPVSNYFFSMCFCFWIFMNFDSHEYGQMRMAELPYKKGAVHRPCTVIRANSLLSVLNIILSFFVTVLTPP